MSAVSAWFRLWALEFASIGLTIVVLAGMGTAVAYVGHVTWGWLPHAHPMGCAYTVVVRWPLSTQRMTIQSSADVQVGDTFSAYLPEVPGRSELSVTLTKCRPWRGASSSAVGEPGPEAGRNRAAGVSPGGAIGNIHNLAGTPN